MNNEKECKNCRAFVQIENVTKGVCFPVAKYLNNDAKNPMVVPYSFGCVLWEEAEHEEQPKCGIRKLSYYTTLVNHEMLSNKIDEIIDYLNRS